MVMLCVDEQGVSEIEGPVLLAYEAFFLLGAMFWRHQEDVSGSRR